MPPKSRAHPRTLPTITQSPSQTASLQQSGQCAEPQSPNGKRPNPLRRSSLLASNAQNLESNTESQKATPVPHPWLAPPPQRRECIVVRRERGEEVPRRRRLRCGRGRGRRRRQGPWPCGSSLTKARRSGEEGRLRRRARLPLLRPPTRRKRSNNTARPSSFSILLDKGISQLPSVRIFFSSLHMGRIVRWLAALRAEAPSSPHHFGPDQILGLVSGTSAGQSTPLR